jgi:fatty-acyl-CoA synthase
LYADRPRRQSRLPDAFEFVDAIPRTSAGKFKERELRERYKDYRAT